MDKQFAAMFDPIQIGTMHVKNRIVMAPMHTRYASESGEVTQRMVSYLIERARGEVGLIVLENTCIDWCYGRAAGNPVTIHDDVNRSGLSNIPLAVHRYGARIVTQLHHTGRQNLRSNIEGGKAPVAPSAVKSNVGGDEPRPLEEHEIQDIIQKYVDAARRTKDAGFDGVELHAAHGYLFTQFFSPHTNRREDKWGGSFENRARFPVEVIRRIRMEVGPDFPILYRISAEERIPGGTTLEDTLRLVKLLEEAGVDCFDVTAGIYESMEWIFTMQGVAPGSLIPLAAAVKGVTTKPVIGISRLGFDVDYAAQVLKEKKVDMVAMGRSFLADPHIPRKILEGRTQEIRPCIACNDCVGNIFSGWQVHCTVNPATSSEFLDPVKPSLSPKKVAVVGGGPGGMECAIVAAQRGHQVTLFEKSKELGGQLRAASVPAYKRRELSALLGYYKAMIQKLGIRVKLDTEVKRQVPGDLKADVVVLATGAVPHARRFAGGEYVLDAFDVLLNHGKGVGQKVVVIGGSGVGIDTSLFLAEKEGRTITLVEMLPEIGGDLNELIKPHVVDMAREKGIALLDKTEVSRVEKGKVHVKTLFGEKTLTCDTAVSAVGFASCPTADLKKYLQDKGREVFVVGSAIEPGKIFDATQSGFWTAVEL